MSAIGGESSGAIAAFTAAWERPAAFSRVFSAIGTYVDLRGGLLFPDVGHLDVLGFMATIGYDLTAL